MRTVGSAWLKELYKLFAPVREVRWAVQRGGAVGSEMEAATIFVVASVLGTRAGGIMRAGRNPDLTPRDHAAPPADPPLDDLIATAIAGLKLLIARDRA